MSSTLVDLIPVIVVNGIPVVSAVVAVVSAVAAIVSAVISLSPAVSAVVAAVGDTFWVSLVMVCGFVVAMVISGGDR